MILEREAVRHQAAQRADTPNHVVDATALPALEVVVVDLPCGLVSHRLAGQGHWADAALI
jgi:hypothetical protein